MKITLPALLVFAALYTPSGAFAIGPHQHAAPPTIRPPSTAPVPTNATHSACRTRQVCSPTGPNGQQHCIPQWVCG